MAESKTSKKATPKKEVVKVDENAKVIITATKDHNGLVKGKDYPVSGNVANILIGKKLAELK